MALIDTDSLLAGAECDIDSRAMLQLVPDSGCSACDCDVIALAIKRNTAFVTMDKKRLKALSQRAVTLSSG